MEVSQALSLIDKRGAVSEVSRDLEHFKIISSRKFIHPFVAQCKASAQRHVIDNGLPETYEVIHTQQLSTEGAEERGFSVAGKPGLQRKNLFPSLHHKH